MPKVSICIPAFEQPELLRRTLHSIFDQTYTDFEIILTDDSRNDGIEKMLKDNAWKEKVHYIKNATQLGSPENWNEAIRHANGQYIKIMHHDDWFSSPDSLKKYVLLLDTNSQADFAFSATLIINQSTQATSVNCPDSMWLDKLKKNPAILFFANFIGAPSACIFRKDKRITFDKNIRYVVDIDFYIRKLTTNPQFVFCAETLISNTSGFEHQVTQASQDAATQIGEYAYLYNKIRKQFLPTKEHLLFFRQLFLKYKIKSWTQLTALSIPKPKPYLIFALLLVYLNFNRK